MTHRRSPVAAPLRDEDAGSHEDRVVRGGVAVAVRAAIEDAHLIQRPDRAFEPFHRAGKTAIRDVCRLEVEPVEVDWSAHTATQACRYYSPALDQNRNPGPSRRPFRHPEWSRSNGP